MTQPKRIQLRRTKGWRKPEGAVVVARPSKWGNPFTVHYPGGFTWNVEGFGRRWTGFRSKELATEFAVNQYRWLLTAAPVHMRKAPRFDDLRGRDLACWCPLDQPCHADVLLELANR